MPAGGVGSLLAVTPLLCHHQYETRING